MSIATTRDRRMQIIADLEAERRLLGVALLDLRALDDFAVKDEHFYSRAHRELWIAIEAVAGVGVTPSFDVGDVCDELRARGTDVTVHAEHPARIIVPIIQNPMLVLEHAPLYARTVIGMWRARHLAYALDRADARLRLAHDFDDVVRELEARVRELEGVRADVPRRPWLARGAA